MKIDAHSIAEANILRGVAKQVVEGPVDGGHLPVVTRLNNVKFRRMVRPGETLDIHAEFVERLSSAYFLKARTEVDGQATCSLEFACTLTSKKAP